MGTHVTKQPNERFAIYNTGSDLFDQRNLTEQDVLALTLLKHIESGRQDAQEALQKANQFTDRFEEDLELIAANETQTPEEIQALRALMSTPPPAEEAASTSILRKLLAAMEDLTQQYGQAREVEAQQEEEPQ